MQNVAPAGFVHVPLLENSWRLAPPEGAELVHAEPLLVKTLPLAPGEASPVPPLAAGSVPVTPVESETFVTVLLAALIVLLVSVAVLLAVRTLLGVMMLDRVAMHYPTYHE